MEKKTIWLSTFKYVVPAEYEAFLENLAIQGWNVVKIGQWSSLKMDFVKTEPKKYRYIFDINTNPKKDYKEIYEQFGWEFVGQMASCFIWRVEYIDIRPESFSDLQSARIRNMNVRNAVMISFFIFLIAFVIVAICFGFYVPRGLEKGELIQYIIGILLSFSFTVYFGWVVNKINKSIKE